MPPAEFIGGGLLMTLGGLFLLFGVVSIKLLGDFLAWNYRRKQAKSSSRNPSLTRTESSPT